MSTTSPDRPDATSEARPAPAPEDAGTTVSQEPSEAAAQASNDTPDDVLLIDPARVRRAPRYPVFLTLGAIVGIVAGLVLGQYLVASVDPSGTGASLLKPGVFVAVTVLGTTTFAMLLAGLVAVVLDRRSVRRTRGD